MVSVTDDKLHDFSLLCCSAAHIGYILPFFSSTFVSCNALIVRGCPSCEFFLTLLFEFGPSRCCFVVCLTIVRFPSS